MEVEEYSTSGIADSVIRGGCDSVIMEDSEEEISEGENQRSNPFPPPQQDRISRQSSKVARVSSTLSNASSINQQILQHSFTVSSANDGKQSGATGTRGSMIGINAANVHRSTTLPANLSPPTSVAEELVELRKGGGVGEDENRNSKKSSCSSSKRGSSSDDITANVDVKKLVQRLSLKSTDEQEHNNLRTVSLCYPQTNAGMGSRTHYV